MKSNESSPKPAIFMHIQKTAGTSIVNLARNEYDPNQVVSHGDYLNGCSERDCSLDSIVNVRGLSPKEFSNKSFVSGHFGFDFAKPLLNGRYSFTFLRDPIERILSYYYFCRTRDPLEYEIYSLTQVLTLDQFLILGLDRPSIKAQIWNNQAWQLASGYGSSNGINIWSYSPEKILELAIQHLDDFSYIGFAETFEKDRDHILKALGIVPPLEKVVSNANPNRPKANDLPESSLNLLNELTYLDRELYKVAWSRMGDKNGY